VPGKWRGLISLEVVSPPERVFLEVRGEKTAGNDEISTLTPLFSTLPFLGG